MIEIKGDFWELSSKYKMIGVTTNGIVKDSGELVMGKGIAKEFKKRYPTLPKIFGEKISVKGNVPHFVVLGENFIFSFPTKFHYEMKSDLKLIEMSATRLMNIIGLNTSYELLKSDDNALLTRPGCGNGGLDWETQVKPILDPIFDDRIHIVYNGE